MHSKPLELHVERNRTTRSAWDAYKSHRDHVMRILERNANRREESSLLVLGFGNGNDLDLARLTNFYHSITIVDIDADAVHNAVSKLEDATRESIVVKAPFDVSGVLSDSKDWVASELINEMSRFDIVDHLPRSTHVISTCLLSQVIDSFNVIFPEDDEDRVDVALAARDAHLKLLVDLALPGGKAMLVTDFVSSISLPQLPDAPTQNLQPLLVDAINRKNFFTGVNPAVLHKKLSPECNELVGKLTHEGVWRWQLGKRCYAVTGFTAEVASSRKL